MRILLVHAKTRLIVQMHREYSEREQCIRQQYLASLTRNVGYGDKRAFFARLTHVFLCSRGGQFISKASLFLERRGKALFFFPRFISRTFEWLV
jgi:hypothetical protein